MYRGLGGFCLVGRQARRQVPAPCGQSAFEWADVTVRGKLVNECLRGGIGQAAELIDLYLPDMQRGVLISSAHWHGGTSFHTRHSLTHRQPCLELTSSYSEAPSGFLIV